jgi:endonuclease YncB( thermonuclease family)
MIRDRIAVPAAFCAIVMAGASPSRAVDAGATDRPATVATIDGRSIAVLDGDSLMVDGVEWRLMGYDAPEIDRAVCEGERRTGIHAREHLARLLSDAARAAAPLALTDSGERDRYRRPLARLVIAGRDVADLMVESLHGRPYNGGRRKGWCSRDSRDDLIPGPPPCHPSNAKRPRRAIPGDSAAGAGVRSVTPDLVGTADGDVA